MKITVLITLILLYTVCTSCSDIANTSHSHISIAIKSEPQNTTISRAVTKLNITVSAADFDTLTHEVLLQNGKAQIELSIPKGDDRVITVMGYDENSRLQCRGAAKVNLHKTNEIVSITVAWLPPPPVTLSIDSIGTTTINISWTPSTVEDFGQYRIVGSTRSEFDLIKDTLHTPITNKSITKTVISNLQANMTYYIAVITLDTEGKFNDLTNDVKIVKTKHSVLSPLFGDWKQTALHYDSLGTWKILDSTVNSFTYSSVSLNENQRYTLTLKTKTNTIYTTGTWSVNESDSKLLFTPENDSTTAYGAYTISSDTLRVLQENNITKEKTRITFLKSSLF